MGKDIWTIPFDNLTQTLKASTYSFCNCFIHSVWHLSTNASSFRICTLRRYSIWFRKCSLSFLFFSSISVFSTQPYSASVPLASRLLWSASEPQIHSPWYSNARQYPSWDGWTGEYVGKCININTFSWIRAAIEIIIDLAIISLPIPLLLGLKLNWHKKLQILSMFSVGFLWVAFSWRFC